MKDRRTPHIDFGHSNLLVVNNDVLADPSGQVVYNSPRPIPPRPPEWGPLPTEPPPPDAARIAAATAEHAALKAEADVEIEKLEQQIRIWREKVQVARNRLLSVSG